MKRPIVGNSHIPVRASVVCAYIILRNPDDPKFLLLKRKSKYMHGLWGQVAGKIEDGENPVEAILREIREETGKRPQALYSADIVEIFYEPTLNFIEIIPVFVAELSGQDIVLSNEHSEFKWVTPAEAKRILSFPQQRFSVDTIVREFIEKEPPSQLGIVIP
jgi:dATP pyrophosphohydrolase